MTQIWRSDPSLKVEVDSTEITQDSVSIEVFRIENAVSRCVLIANDYQGKNFIANLDAFDNLKISVRYGSDSWTKEFDGIVEDVGPKLSSQGQILAALGYGQGRAIRNTHCNVDYGSESENPTLDTPKEIWDDLVDNRINKDFDGNAIYSITKTYIANLANPTIYHIHNPYRPNIHVINEVCQIYTAYRAGSASVHWFVDPSKNLFINTIGAHENSAEWPNYWGGSQAASTLVEGEDLINYNFWKRVRSKDYANRIVLCTDLRKPGRDRWTEGLSASWGTAATGTANITLSDEAGAGLYVVGSNSLKIDVTGTGQGYAFYPSAENADWDFTKIGSEKSVPELKFYFRKNADFTELTSYIVLFSTDHDTDFFATGFSTWTDPDDEWIHRSMPISDYWKTTDESRRYRWTVNGNPNWNNINGICFVVTGAGADHAMLYVDDLHFVAKIIRESYNSTAIAANEEHQKIVQMKTTVDDTMDESDDSGTAARLAYAELLTSQTIPIVGTVETPGIVGILPGQKVHIHADKQSSGSFRIDKDFRIKRITHRFNTSGFTTTLDLTDDLLNTFAKGPSEMRGILKLAVFADPEAMSVKSSGIDPLVPRLSIDYP